MLEEMASNAPGSLQIPQISHDELRAFQQSHFSTEAVANFGSTFVRPDSNAAHEFDAANQRHDGWQGEEEDEEEDDLGYYDDGVKRTLTDEQIEIFRHSEIREFQRAREKAAQMKPAPTQDESGNATTKVSVQIDGTGLPPGFQSKKKKKKKKAALKEPKPDLRKRTWDVVEAGLDSLDYD